MVTFRHYSTTLLMHLQDLLQLKVKASIFPQVDKGNWVLPSHFQLDKHQLHQGLL